MCKKLSWQEHLDIAKKEGKEEGFDSGLVVGAIGTVLVGALLVALSPKE